MTTLVINAPKQTVAQENKRDFATTYNTGVGDEYAIYANLRAQLSAGCRVILLSKDEAKQAEGELVELVPRTKTNSGVQRYDVRIRNLRMVVYRGDDIPLNRCGVAVLNRD